MKQLKDKLYIIFVIFFLICAGIFQYFDASLQPFWKNLFSMLANFIFFCLIIAWTLYVKYRLVQRFVRVNMMICSFLILFWLTIRFIKYDFFPDDSTAARYLWYLYYVPQCLIPIFGIISMFGIEQKDNKRVPLKNYLLFVPSIILIILILTNDLHELAFSFPNGINNFHEKYNHEIIYYITIGWIILTTFLFIVILSVKCHTATCKKRVWVPILTFIMGLTICILGFILNFQSFKIPELLSMTFIAIFESCVWIGLIPTNKNYNLYFSNSHTSAVLVDNQNKIIYKSNNTLNFTPKQINECTDKQVNINKNIILKSAKILGGRVLWLEYIKTINEYNKKLEEINELLSEENEILKAENELNEKKIKVEEQNKIYDYINNLINEDVKLVKSYISKPNLTIAELKFCSFLTAYIKRKSNLALLSKRNNLISLSELALSIKECLYYLNDCDVLTSLISYDDCDLGSEQTILILTIFKACIMDAYPTINACLIHITVNKVEVHIRIVMDNANKIPDPTLFNQELTKNNGKLNVTTNDETTYVTLTFKRGDEK